MTVGQLRHEPVHEMVSERGGQGAPPYAGSVTTVRVRVCVPVFSQPALQPEYGPKSETSQSTAGGGCAGGGGDSGGGGEGGGSEGGGGDSGGGGENFPCQVG